MTDPSSLYQNASNPGLAVVLGKSMPEPGTLLGSAMQQKQKQDLQREQQRAEANKRVITQTINELKLPEKIITSHKKEIASIGSDLIKRMVTADIEGKNINSPEYMDELNRLQVLKMDAEGWKSQLAEFDTFLEKNPYIDKDKAYESVVLPYQVDEEGNPKSVESISNVNLMKEFWEQRGQVNPNKHFSDFAESTRKSINSYRRESIGGGDVGIFDVVTEASDFVVLKPDGKVDIDPKTNIPILKATPEALKAYTETKEGQVVIRDRKELLLKDNPEATDLDAFKSIMQDAYKLNPESFYKEDAKLKRLAPNDKDGSSADKKTVEEKAQEWMPVLQSAVSGDQASINMFNNSFKGYKIEYVAPQAGAGVPVTFGNFKGQAGKKAPQSGKLVIKQQTKNMNGDITWVVKDELDLSDTNAAMIALSNLIPEKNINLEIKKLLSKPTDEGEEGIDLDLNFNRN